MTRDIIVLPFIMLGGVALAIITVVVFMLKAEQRLQELQPRVDEIQRLATDLAMEQSSFLELRRSAPSKDHHR